MVIQQIKEEELYRIQDLANKTWFITYNKILKEDQLNYMFNLMYKIDNLKYNINNGSRFFILKVGKEDLAFIELKTEKNYLKINKIYVLQNNQGKGYGKHLINKACAIGKSENCQHIELNVNRFNKAIDFYIKNKFEIVKEVDIKIGNGYLMEDYVMLKNI